MQNYASQFEPTAKTHVDGFDRTAREALASKLGTTEEKVAKAIRMVGNRISTITAYLK